MLDNTSKWSHPRGNTVVPSRWQATYTTLNTQEHPKRSRTITVQRRAPKDKVS